MFGGLTELNRKASMVTVGAFLPKRLKIEKYEIPSGFHGVRPEPLQRSGYQKEGTS